MSSKRVWVDIFNRLEGVRFTRLAPLLKTVNKVLRKKFSRGVLNQTVFSRQMIPDTFLGHPDTEIRLFGLILTV